MSVPATKYISRNKFNWQEFVCGWGAAFINVTVTYPINKLIFRQILHGIKAKSAFIQLKNEGLYYLYRGILPPLCQKTLSLSIMFGVYEEVRQPLLQMGVNPYTSKIMGALVSGSTEALLMPFERVQTLLSNAQYHNEYKNTLHTFKALKKYGIGEYYRGLVPILLRNGPSNVGFFILREEVQNRIPRSKSEIIRTSGEFISGALIGVFLSCVFYPLNVMKIAMQNKVGVEYENPWNVLVQVYKERGGKVRYIYRGVNMNCTRAFLSWGVMNTAYEHIKAFVY
ncbi:mitochondrial nicotinamide adenine dinucleotide transporter SLC25A52 [Rhynchophorus ferrugineus]|uniref:Solute carrier family 25 member 51 n=1 Tax=Rhynchophorus ferrugineus TaxID=354439 RepID=A0A834IHZ2_RHYFE|nr:hypothetical protein GWI33_008536 [Rhynchophorus ferrugineus]